MTGRIRAKRRSSLVVEIALLIVVIIVVLPIVWLVLLSFLPNRAIVSRDWIFPFWLGNFRAIFDDGTFAVQMLNSVGIVLGTVAVCIVIGSISGYALARLSPPKWATIPTLALAAIVPLVPPATLVPGLYELLNDIGLLGSVSGLILVNSLFNLPFATLLMMSYFSGVPMQLREAALVDGATEAGVFVRIMLPLVRPGLAATSIFVGIMAWNEFLMGLTLTSGGPTAPLTVGIAGFVQEFAVTWGELAAAGAVAAVPLIVLAVFANKQIIAGLTAGAVKG
ncbi:carbohydrate ABC transporter permease [Microbacterium sp. ARD32]|uniref:carbohydrate ABC transporter permease n=1 Tax=Microbacterium sp. ARD32 TaxID=2962577 RepID=UPI0028821F67|nr:carbohydrate ABC transporter permease [Microbacterium sp. ARD32]MDT0158232.1 carbohydrate ABC transporter permease [Microbacterium sp. ARD32]